MHITEIKVCSCSGINFFVFVFFTYITYLNMTSKIGLLVQCRSLVAKQLYGVKLCGMFINFNSVQSVISSTLNCSVFCTNICYSLTNNAHPS